MPERTAFCALLLVSPLTLLVAEQKLTSHDGSSLSP